MGMATGILEVFGLVAAFVACDAGCKAADVTVENFDKNKPGNADALEVPLIVAIKFRGTVDAVEAAIDLLAPDGVLIVAIYPGHEEGALEGDMLREYFKTLSKYRICASEFHILNSPTSPYFYLIEKTARQID